MKGKRLSYEDKSTYHIMIFLVSQMIPMKRWAAAMFQHGSSSPSHIDEVNLLFSFHPAFLCVSSCAERYTHIVRCRVPSHGESHFKFYYPKVNRGSLRPV